MGPEHDADVRTTAVIVTTVAAILLVLLLLLVSNDLISLQREDGEPDDGPPDETEPRPTVIAEDTEWADRDETLSNPIIISTGATLKVVRSELRVELLDLVLGNRSWISVEEGGRLELVDTNLSIVYDEWLEDAVMACGRKYRSTPYSVSRAVNLEGAVEPVLSFGVRWYVGRGNLTVAVQPAPGDDLVVLDIVRPDANLTDGWAHRSVPLGDYAGRVVRIILFTDYAGYRDVILGDLVVTDGASDLPNDRFPTGRAWEDGWKCDRFGPFFLAMGEDLENWEPLLVVGGEVIVDRSRVSAPYGLYRDDLWYSCSKYQLQRYESTEEFPRSSGPYWSSASGGGHIFVEDGSLVADLVEFVNVPIIVSEGEVDIRDSSLESDADILALDRSLGSIVGSHFTTYVFEPRQRGYYSNEPRTVGTAIAVSFNSSEGPVRIKDCQIDGPYMALDLNRAWVEVDGCTIDNVVWIAIWDHDGRGLGTWDQLSSSNDVGSAGLYRLFRTHTAIFEMVGVGRPMEGSTYGWYTGIIDWTGFEDDGYTLNNRIIEVDPYRTYILMPTFTVDADGTTNRVEEVMVHGWTSWGGYEDVLLDTDLREGTIRMDPFLADDYNYWDTRTRYELSQSHGGLPGHVSLGMDVDVPGDYADIYWLNFYLDGEATATYSGWEANDSRYGNYEGTFNHSFSVPRGLHALGIELVGIGNSETEPTQLLNDTLWYYHAVLEEDIPEVRAFVAEGCGTAIIGPGLQLVLDRLPASAATGDDPSQCVFLEEWSRLTVRGEETLVSESLNLLVSGHGSLALDGIEAGELRLSLEGCDLALDNVTAGKASIYLEGGEHHIRNLRGLNGTSVHLSDGAKLAMMDSELGLTEYWWGSLIALDCATAVLSNITVEDMHGWGLSVYLGRNGTFQLTGSTFQGAGLDLYSMVYSMRDVPVNASVLVSDCVFKGEGAHIDVLDYTYSWTGRGSFLPDSTILRNRFSGEGTWLTCHRHLAEWLLENNTLEGGCPFYAVYELVYSWPEGHDSSDTRAEILLDEDLLRVTEAVLGHEWEPWEPIYVEGTLDPLSIVDPEPVPIVIMEDYNTVGRADMWWIIGFSHVDPMRTNEVLDVPEWEPVADLIRSHYGDAWNQGQ